MEFTRKRPTGADLIDVLINLLADQESCKIIYSVTGADGNIRTKECDKSEKNCFSEMKDIMEKPDNKLKKEDEKRKRGS